MVDYRRIIAVSLCLLQGTSLCLAASLGSVPIPNFPNSLTSLPSIKAPLPPPEEGAETSESSILERQVSALVSVDDEASTPAIESYTIFDDVTEDDLTSSTVLPQVGTIASTSLSDVTTNDPLIVPTVTPSPSSPALVSSDSDSESSEECSDESDEDSDEESDVDSDEDSGEDSDDSSEDSDEDSDDSSEDSSDDSDESLWRKKNKLILCRKKVFIKNKHSPIDITLEKTTFVKQDPTRVDKLIGKGISTIGGVVNTEIDVRDEKIRPNEIHDLQSRITGIYDKNAENDIGSPKTTLMGALIGNTSGLKLETTNALKVIHEVSSKTSLMNTPEEIIITDSPNVRANQPTRDEPSAILVSGKQTE